MAQVMMADDWCGFNSSVESLHAQWKIWVDYALASGSPIGVEDLEKTVVTAARYDGKKWVDVKVVVVIPHGSGGMEGLTEVVPQFRSRGLMVDCCAWYLWLPNTTQLNGQHLGFDSCGDFYIGGHVEVLPTWSLFDLRRLTAVADIVPEDT